MAIDSDFKAMFKILEGHGIYSTETFRKDIGDLVKTNKKKFIKEFLKDFTIKIPTKQYNRFEILNLNNKQRKKLEGKNLYRYEYRENSNLRCIYIVEDEDNNIILLKAFNENGGKKKAKGSYNNNIEKAIRIYSELQKED